MGLDQEVEKDISRIEKKVHTGTGSTRLRQKNENESGCIGLYDRRSIIYGV